jgi:hypothetical protein
MRSSFARFAQCHRSEACWVTLSFIHSVHDAMDHGGVNRFKVCGRGEQSACFTPSFLDHPGHQ